MTQFWLKSTASCLIVTATLALSACATSDKDKNPSATSSTQNKYASTGFQHPHTQHYDANKLLNDQYRSQRALYQQAKYRTLSSAQQKQLESYPLFGYLVYEQLEKTSYLNKQQVSRFLAHEKNTYIERKIRDRWLKQLMDSGNYTEVISDYNPENASSQATCDYLSSLTYTGQAQQALSKVGDVWLTGSSLPNSCDSIINQWRVSPYFKNDLAWQRMHLAFDANNPRIAQHVANMMSGSEGGLAQAYVASYNSPTMLSSYAGRFANHPQGASILSHVLQQLAAQRPRQAASIYSSVYKSASFSQEQRDDIARAMGKGVDTDYKLLLKAQNWDAVYSLVSILPPEELKKAKWSYWQARALEQKGQKQQATQLYQRAAQERDYYGFLAADKIKAPYQLKHRNNPAPRNDVLHMAQRAGIQRAIELFRLEDYTQARREWNHATQNFNDNDWLAAAQVAHESGWHQQAIFTIAKASFWDDTELRFPVIYENQIQRAATFEGIDSNWIYGITRQESAFGNTAISHAGAQGLMQLMPATASATARSLNLPYERYRLNDPNYNIQLGSHYLNKMYKRFNGNRILASAAYNAGPGRAKQWLNETYNATPADIWVENIPYRETRQYVKNVLMYNIIYGLKRNDRVQILESQERIITSFY